MNCKVYVDGKLNIQLLKEHKWLKYLVVTENISTNIERVDRLSDITGRETLDYALKTLEIFEQNRIGNEKLDYYVLTALQWSEVAKGGSPAVREMWKRRGYNLDIHNLGSSKIYSRECNDTDKDKQIIYTLIKTHGLIGQYLRGEVNLKESKDLYFLVKEGFLTKEELIDCAMLLNKCIIKAVSDKLYNRLERDIEDAILKVADGKFIEIPIATRISKLKSGCFIDKATEYALDMIFKVCDFWYVEPSVKDFDNESFIKILLAIQNYKDITMVRHISFKEMLNNLYYDYEDKKKINIYKKRIIEDLLNRFTRKDITSGADVRSQHTWLDMQLVGDTLTVDFKFTKASRKLIEFCVESERSGLAEYQQSIVLLYDMFGLRKDKFDRLSNEDKYLENMNKSEQNSTKKNILDYLIGDSVLDVGTGGGIMLDRISESKPNIKEVYGCDISTEVINTLNKRKEVENKKWNVFELNLVMEKAQRKFDNILFSSILHEIYSYTDFNGMKFTEQSVVNALHNAFASLNDGGRIIIRDGVRVDNDSFICVRLKDREAAKWLEKFIKDFRAYDRVYKSTDIKQIDELNYVMPLDYAREVIFHMSWTLAEKGSGKIFNDNYQYEQHEAFGYFKLSDFEKVATTFGGKIIKAEAYLENGYYAHTKDRIELLDLEANEIAYPNSTCFVVIEKE